ncbi:hypothetical protein Bbelb_172940 [Branchiostoma belcheri]|nr:hypothetical protein Bbelb_172940 [Branchiostoma belcheri]
MPLKDPSTCRCGVTVECSALAKEGLKIRITPAVSPNCGLGTRTATPDVERSSCLDVCLSALLIMWMTYVPVEGESEIAHMNMKRACAVASCDQLGRWTDFLFLQLETWSDAIWTSTKIPTKISSTDRIHKDPLMPCVGVWLRLSALSANSSHLPRIAQQTVPPLPPARPRKLRLGQAESPRRATFGVHGTNIGEFTASFHLQMPPHSSRRPAASDVCFPS